MKKTNACLDTFVCTMINHEMLYIKKCWQVILAVYRRSCSISVFVFLILIFIMSTNSLPPFGDIVVVTPGDSFQDGFEWDEMQMKVIY